MFQLSGFYYKKSVSTNIDTYIYIERERERKRERLQSYDMVTFKAQVSTRQLHAAFGNCDERLL